MTEAIDPGSGMSSAKRPAPDSNTSAAKRQDIGIGKDTKDSKHITPRLAAGAYRLVNNLQRSYTGSAEQTNWPAIVLDDDMKETLLSGKYKPQTAKDAFEWPGAFTGAVKISEKDRVVPVQLLLNDAGALYVPSRLLTVMQCSSVVQLADDKTIPEALRQAYAAIRDGHDIEYWKARLVGAKKDADEHEVSSESELESNHHEDEELVRAALEQLDKSEPPRAASPAHVPTDRAKSVDAAMPSEDVTMIDEVDVKEESETIQPESKPVKTTGVPPSQQASADIGSSGHNTALGSNAITNEDATMSGIRTTATVETPTIKSELAQGEGSGDVKAKVIKTETKHHLELSKNERSDIRRRKAQRKATSDEVRFTVGRQNEEFIVKKARLEESKYFKDKIEYDPDDNEYHLATHKFNRFDPDDFEPVAEFLSTGDYYPRVIETEQGEVLKDFDKTDSNLSGKLVIQSINLCKIATQFEMDNLRKAAIRKFKLLAPYTPSNFQQFFGIMYDQDFCKDEELKQWVFDYAAKHFFDLLDDEGKFKTFLQNFPVIATKIFRLLVGLPAEEEVATPKKRGAGRKRAGSDDKPKQAAPRKSTGAAKTTTTPKPATPAKPVTAPKTTATKTAAAKSAEANATKSTTTTKAAAAKPTTGKANAAKADIAKKQAPIKEAESDDEEEDSGWEEDGDEIAGRPMPMEQAKAPETPAPKPKGRPPKDKTPAAPKPKPTASKAASNTVTPKPAPSNTSVTDTDEANADAVPSKPKKTAAGKKQTASKPATPAEPIKMTQTLFTEDKKKKKDMPPPEKPSPGETEVKPKPTRKRAAPAAKTPKTPKTLATPNLIDQLSQASAKHNEVAGPSPIGLGDEIMDDDE